jgi:hypothetical protein
MELTPHERQRIYEEEKARLETRAQLQREQLKGRFSERRKYVWLVIGLLAIAITFWLYTRHRAVREFQTTLENLGFKPGELYCYAPDADKNSNGYAASWPLERMDASNGS